MFDLSSVSSFAILRSANIGNPFGFFAFISIICNFIAN